MATLESLLASPYDPRHATLQGGQLADLEQASLQTRNTTLQSLLSQLDTPLTNVYEAGGVDSLVQQLREGRQSRAEGLAQRGLQYSGAAPTSERALRDIYSRGLLDNVMSSNQTEQNRKLSLMQQLLGLTQNDLEYLDAIGGSKLEGAAADFSLGQDTLLKNLELAHGAGVIASLLVGGAAGAAGGAAGGAFGGASGVSGGAAAGTAGGLSGAGAGALGGLQFASQFGGGGGGGYTPPSAGGAGSYGGKPATSNPYGFNVGQDYMRSQISENPEFTALLYRGRY